MKYFLIMTFILVATYIGVTQTGLVEVGEVKDMTPQVTIVDE